VLRGNTQEDLPGGTLEHRSNSDVSGADNCSITHECPGKVSKSCTGCEVHWRTYRECEISAVAKMNSLEHAGSDRSTVADLFRFGKRQNAAVRNISTLDQAYPLQLWQGCQLRNGTVCQIRATCQINVPNAVAQLHKLDNTRVGNARAMTQVNVMQILAKARYGHNSSVRDLAAFIEDKVAETRCGLNNLLYARVLELAAVGEIKNAKGVVGGLRGP
jgi:hypothetical protein